MAASVRSTFVRIKGRPGSPVRLWKTLVSRQYPLCPARASRPSGPPCALPWTARRIISPKRRQDVPIIAKMEMPTLKRRFSDMQLQQTKSKRNRPTPMLLAGATDSSSSEQATIQNVLCAWKSFVISKLDETRALLEQHPQDTQLRANSDDSKLHDPVGCPLEAAHTAIHKAIGRLVDVTFAGSVRFRSKCKNYSTIPSLEEIQDAADKYCAKSLKPWRWQATNPYTCA